MSRSRLVRWARLAVWKVLVEWLGCEVEGSVSGQWLRFGPESGPTGRTCWVSGRTHEPGTEEWLSRLEPGDQFVDVGAAVGVFSRLAGERGAEVLAFEPDRWRYWMARANLAPVSVPWVVLAERVGIQAPAETRLDSMVGLNGSGRTFVKVDVEGAELNVLWSAERILAGDQPVAWWVECHEPERLRRVCRWLNRWEPAGLLVHGDGPRF